jgi:hypothetical protein
MAPELQSAVDNARRVFARYSLNGRIIVCNCPVCVAPEIERQLIRTPLHAISRDLLTEYTHSAHGWDGKIADDFRYFLPRYFELIAAGEIPCNNGLETCLGRMLHAAYGKDWPQEEADAIDGFFVALFRAELGKPLGPADYSLFDAGEGAEAVLCCMAHAGGDVRLLLDVWERTAGREADVRIARTIVAADWRIRDLSNTWWSVADRKPVRQAMNTIIAWLLRTETWERLEAACLNETDSMTAELFSQAQSMIARYS